MDAGFPPSHREKVAKHSQTTTPGTPRLDLVPLPMLLTHQPTGICQLPIPHQQTLVKTAHVEQRMNACNRYRRCASSLARPSGGFLAAAVTAEVVARIGEGDINATARKSFWGFQLVGKTPFVWDSGRVCNLWFFIWQCLPLRPV